MTIHHLNCGTLKPHYPKLKSLVYCLLVESNRGLILVDTGIGTRDYSQPSLMMRFFIRLLGVPGDVKETALEQVKALGFSLEDVKHIVFTHLHLDHAGGLPDFPGAQIHVYRGEYEAMMQHQGMMSWGCEKDHFRHNPRWILHDFDGESWYGFKSISIIKGVQPEIKLILLPGHTRGHCGVAIKTDKGWLLHCGDAASPFHKHTDVNNLPSELHKMPYMPKWFTRMIVGSHVPALRALHRELDEEINMISGHDIYSFEKYTKIR